MDAEDWDRRYAANDYVWTVRPNAFLVREVEQMTPGRAIDLACGEGRNAVWLARLGWEVTGVDFSAVALDKARRLAEEHGVSARWEQADLLAWEPPADGAELVVVLYLQLPAGQRRIALANATRALRPGGTVLVVAHDQRNLAEGVGGPADPAVLYGPDDAVADLRAAGVDLDVERAETVERVVDGADRPALDCLVRARRRVAS